MENATVQYYTGKNKQRKFIQKNATTLAFEKKKDKLLNKWQFIVMTTKKPNNN